MIKSTVKAMTIYLKVLIKWTLLALLVGAIGGVIGSVFHICIDKVTELRTEKTFLMYFLPIGGLLICAMYHLFAKKGKIDTNRVIDAVREDKNVPLVMMPLIFISTVITHLFGGSAGREGAALQLGGSIGYNTGKIFKLDEKNMHIIVMSGMAAVFSALFGTPITAAVFAIEVVTVGILHYAALIPCVISAIVAFLISKLFGLGGVSFSGIAVESLTAISLLKVGALAILCGVVSILFCCAIKKCEHFAEKFLPNKYLRAFVGGAIIVMLALVLGTFDYNGAGMDVITKAMNGRVNGEAFLLKIIFTAITIAVGFKGGEIVPAFFIGSTFGAMMGAVLGMSPAFAAAIGFVSVFCGVVNCPIASIVLSIEVFGAEGLLFFALSCAISYLMSGSFSLYHSQKIMYSKLDDEYIDTFTI